MKNTHITNHMKNSHITNFMKNTHTTNLMKNTPITNLMEILSEEAELFHANEWRGEPKYRQTDEQTLRS